MRRRTIGMHLAAAPVLLFGLVEFAQSSFVSSSEVVASTGLRQQQLPSSSLPLVRGGESKKKKKKKSSSGKPKKKTSGGGSSAATATATAKSKRKDKSDQREIDKLLKEKDAADALGDAIRARADELLREERENPPAFVVDGSPLVQNIDRSVSSLGWALGASDQRKLAEQQLREIASSEERDGADFLVEGEEDHGGVEIAQASVLVQYFLKSHGGAHALQSLCSALASVAGLGAIGFVMSKGGSDNSKSKLVSLSLLKRCCLFAMVKHVSGLLAGSFLAARAIPEIGLRQSRLWMQQLAMDPVSQYVFYSACILLWLPSSLPSTGSAWWQDFPLITTLLVGPIVLREIVSTLLVASDVLVLWTCSHASDNNSGGIAKSLLAVSNTATNAFMSLLVTPKVWKSADATDRQAILAKLTSRISLSMEVGVGVVMAFDAVLSLIGFFFGASVNGQSRNFLQLVKRLVCTRLYLQFLWNRKRKIQKLATKIRGGAVHLPFYLVDVLMDPLASMGMDDAYNNKKGRKQQSSAAVQSTAAARDEKLGDDDDADLSQSSSSRGWRDYVKLAMDIDEN